MGDFNLVEDALDRNGKLPNALEKDRYLFSEWKSLKDDYDLIDAFRVLNPLIRQYSFTHPNKKNRSRINRIYLSDKESGRVLRHNFTDTPWKDHKIISLDLSDVSE